MRKKKGRKRKASASENQTEPEDGEIIEESDETTSCSSSPTPSEKEIMVSDKPSSAAIGSVASSDQADPEDGEIMEEADETTSCPSSTTISKEETVTSDKPNSEENNKAAIGSVASFDQVVAETEESSKVAIGGTATSHQASANTKINEHMPKAVIKESDGPTSCHSSTTIPEKETVAPDKLNNEESNKAAIGSVACSNQAVAESEESSKVAMGSVATSHQDNADSKSSEETPIAVEHQLTEVATDARQETLQPEKPNAAHVADPTPTIVRVDNISPDTTWKNLIDLLGLRTTSYLRDNVRLTLHSNSSGNCNSYAIINAPRHVCDQLCELNGYEFNSRHISIEIISSDSSTTPYDRRGMLRGTNKQNHSLNSGEKIAKEYPRPASNVSSRQEESVSSTNRVVDEIQKTNPEEVGGGQNNQKRNRSMAQVVSDKHNRRLLEERKRCQLHIDIQCRDEGAPPPSANMIYKVFTEQLGLSKDPSNGVEAIYAPNPKNSWRWIILFITENLKTNFQGKTTTRTFTHNQTKTDYTYTFNTRKSPEHLLITIKSSPLIPDEELGSFLEQFGKITAIVRKPHSFAEHIDSGIRQIFLILHKDVRTTDIPGTLYTSDGVWRKLFFKGKPYMCKNCGTIHTHTQGCPTSQQYQFEQQQNYPTSQEHSTEVNLERTDAKQQTRNNTNAQHNPTNTGNTNHGHEEHTTTNSGRNRTHPHIQEHTNTEQQPNNFTEDQSDRGADYTAGTYTNSQEEDFPQSPCLVSNTRNCSVASPPVNDRDTKLQKSMEKVKTKQTGILRRTVKLISPLHNASRSGRKT